VGWARVNWFFVYHYLGDRSFMAIGDTRAVCSLTIGISRRESDPYNDILH